MQRASLILFALALILAATAQGQGVFKCTNPDGSISYQDRECPDAAEEKRVDLGGTTQQSREKDFDSKIIAVPGVGEAGVVVFDYMETTVREDGDRGTPTVLAHPDTGAGAALRTISAALEEVLETTSRL